MSCTNYNPQPIDAAGITLSPELLLLTETLAQSTHDHWAVQRLKDGWKYGPARSDEKKEHPGLLPYGELPEWEKAYDRTTAMETLKAVLALGFSITK